MDIFTSCFRVSKVGDLLNISRYQSGGYETPVVSPFCIFHARFSPIISDLEIDPHFGHVYNAPAQRPFFYTPEPLLRLNIATGSHTALSSLSILHISQLQPCGYLQYMSSTRLNTANCLSPELICDSIVNRSIQT